MPVLQKCKSPLKSNVKFATAFACDSSRACSISPSTAKLRNDLKSNSRRRKGDWQVGLIVGPSGSGKSTVARKAFGDALQQTVDWPIDHAVIDGLRRPLGQGKSRMCCLASDSARHPAWLRPYSVLSNGEKFRCDLARALLDDRLLVAFDEFTSVVDRTVARIGSAAVSKAIRSGKIKRRFVAISCHYDIAEWLEPDWILDMATGKLARGRLRRPAIDLEIIRADRSAWAVFKRHHYLNTSLNPAAGCFVAMVDGFGRRR